MTTLTKEEALDRLLAQIVERGAVFTWRTSLIAELVQRGHVEFAGSSHPLGPEWRPTDAGRAALADKPGAEGSRP